MSGARDRAEALILFADGAEEAGLLEYAGRVRTVCRDCLQALDELAAERSARVALQAKCDRLEAILLSRHVDYDAA